MKPIAKSAVYIHRLENYLIKRKMKDLSRKIMRFNHSAFYPRDYYYDKLVSKYDNPDFFCTLIDKQNLKRINTATPIRFSSSIEFGASQQSVVHQLGKPNLVHKKIEDFSYKVLFYRFKIGGHKTKCELHLLDDELFFYNYVLSYLTKADREELSAILALKYLNDKTMAIADFKVVDSKNNLLIVDDSIDFSVAYLSGNPTIYKQISHALKKAKVKEQQHVKIKYNELYKCL